MKRLIIVVLQVYLCVQYTIGQESQFHTGTANFHHSNNFLHSFSAYSGNNNVGYLVAANGRENGNRIITDSITVFRTTNKGKDWFPIHTIVKNNYTSPIFDLAFTNLSHGFLSVRTTSSSNFVDGALKDTYKTTDSGRTWTEFNLKAGLRILDYAYDVAVFGKSQDSVFIYKNDALLGIQLPNVILLRTAQVLNDTTVIILGGRSNRPQMVGFVLKVNKTELSITDTFVASDIGRDLAYSLHFSNEPSAGYWHTNGVLYKKVGNKITTVSTPAEVKNLNIIKDTLILTSDYDIYYSTNEGENWQVHPYSGNALFAGNYRSAHYFSFKSVFFTNLQVQRTLWITDELDPIFIYRQPQPQTVCLGDTVELSIGADSVFYQWYFNGTLVANETDSILLLNNVQETNLGTYYCVLTDIVSGSMITLPNNPMKDGLAFAGWFTDDESFSNPFTASTPVTADITVYAKWVILPPIASSILSTLELVPIYAGTFMMGSPASEPNRNDNDGVETQHSVTLTKSFYMGKYEITQGQYLAVMGSYPGTAPNTTYGEGDNYPMYYVNWYDAILFCNRLSIKEGLSPVYSVKVGGEEIDWETVNHLGNPPALPEDPQGLTFRGV